MLLAQDYTLDYSLMIYASIGIYLAASAAAVINMLLIKKLMQLWIELKVTAYKR